MIGHRQIIESRKGGKRPPAIFFDLFGSDIWGGENQIKNGVLPTVTITAEDLGRPIDLRFVAGCRAHVSALAITDDVLAFVDQIVACRASFVGLVSMLETDQVMFYFDGAWRVNE